MKRQVKQPRLRDMTIQHAVARCSVLTTHEWTSLDLNSQADLLDIMREYIMSRYTNIDHPVPANIADVWERCKLIIDREAGR